MASSKAHLHGVLLLFEPGFETKLLLKRIDGAIRVRSNVDPTFDSHVGSGRSERDHRGSSLLESPYIPYQCMDSYLPSAGLGSALMGKMEHLTAHLHRPRTTRSPISFWGDGGIISFEPFFFHAFPVGLEKAAINRISLILLSRKEEHEILFPLSRDREIGSSRLKKDLRVSRVGLGGSLKAFFFLLIRVILQRLARVQLFTSWARSLVQVQDGPAAPRKRIEEASDYFMHALLGSGDIAQLVERSSCNWVVAITVWMSNCPGVGVGGSPRVPSSEIPGKEDQVGPCEQLDALSPFNPLS
ncbi:hypothetical protein ACH5RR_012747 [Cinchona calisaya]|uniref:Uncharacterized protein ycf68 n=1 Tax=Cinchona calisaya TaxID=153742 RepID=A0ABD3A8H2_9GENT